jgi:Transposase IS4
VAGRAGFLPIGGATRYREWSLTLATGERLGPDADVGGRTPLFYFMAMFPPKELSLIVVETNIQFQNSNLPPTSKGEVLKFFGVLILMTRFEFDSRQRLWLRSRISKYIPAPQLGDTGISRDRFDALWRHIRFSSQPMTRPSHVSSENYRWALVQDLVDKFNEHRQQCFNPSDLICVDESMSRWYGQGGFWINLGLPQYISIDRKPENGCEIQNAACGCSGVMLKLKLVKSAESENATVQLDERDLPHGTVVLKDLVYPCSLSDRMFCADSYFALVSAAEELRKMGLRFIGVVKNATRRFPMKALGHMELEKREDCRGLVHLDADNTPSMLAFVWMDRERRYFIASCSSLLPGVPYDRKR